MSIGQNLKMLRKERKLSQKELAELAGITERTIYNYEKEKQTPKPRVINKLAMALNVSAEVLINGAPLNVQSTPQNYFELDRDTFELSELLEKTTALFAGGRLSDDEKDEYYESLTQAYFLAKRKSRFKNQSTTK